MSTLPPDEQFIRKGIENALKREVEEQFEILKKKLIEDLDMKKDQIISGIMLNFMRHVQMNTMHDKVIVTINKIES